MNNLLEQQENGVENMIYEIRGQKVMLASDLAKMYQCKNGTKEINQAVNNNIEKFPNRYSWKLSDEETEEFLVKIFDQKNKLDTRGGKYKNPRAFTEQGVAMLATILKTKVATQVSIQIMDAFVAMRRYVSNNLIEQRFINNQVIKNTEDIKLLQQSFDKLSSKEKNNHIFFEGQIYDAYSKIIDIFHEAKKEIMIIDNYLDKNMLDIISKCKVNVMLITANKLDNLDFIKYRKQYDNLRVIINNSFHDRFIILDEKNIFHMGASLNSLGKKCFAITKMEDNDILDQILKRI